MILGTIQKDVLYRVLVFWYSLSGALQILGFGEYIGEVQAAYEQHKNETLVQIIVFYVYLFSFLLPRNNQVLLIVAELEVCFRLILIPQMIRGFRKCLSYQGFGGFPRGELVKGSTVEIWLYQSVRMLWKVASCMQIVVDDPWTNGMPSFS